MDIAPTYPIYNQGYSPPERFVGSSPPSRGSPMTWESPIYGLEPHHPNIQDIQNTEAQQTAEVHIAQGCGNAHLVAMRLRDLPRELVEWGVPWVKKGKTPWDFFDGFWEGFFRGIS